MSILGSYLEIFGFVLRDIILEVFVQNKGIHEESLTIRIKGISDNNQLYIHSHTEGDNDNYWQEKS